MRKITYISPTSLAQFYKDRTEFYLQRLADVRPPKIPQTQPMAVGSAFDAYIKSYLADALYGVNADARFGFDAIFTAQVEEQNRDWARDAGALCFKEYKRLGGLARLMVEVKLARHTPRMEFEVHGHVGGVPIMGKPDLYFTVEDGSPVLIDFKVNGYCGKSATSPAKGFIHCAGEYGRNNGGPHPDAALKRLGSGIIINTAHPLEVINTDWADQTTMYGWTLGEEVGTPMVIGIEQLACAPGGKLRVASFRSQVSKEYQQALSLKISTMWKILESGHIFTDRAREESDLQCQMLDQYHNGVGKDKLFDTMCRGEDNYRG